MPSFRQLANGEKTQHPRVKTSPSLFLLSVLGERVKQCPFLQKKICLASLPCQCVPCVLAWPLDFISSSWTLGQQSPNSFCFILEPLPFKHWTSYPCHTAEVLLSALLQSLASTRAWCQVMDLVIGRGSEAGEWPTHRETEFAGDGFSHNEAGSTQSSLCHVLSRDLVHLSYLPCAPFFTDMFSKSSMTW